MIKRYKDLITILFSEDTFNDIINRWNEEHRYYHNIDHLDNLISIFDCSFNNGDITDKELDILVVSSFFHDVIYNPRKSDNEEESIKYFKSKCVENDINNKKFIDEISDIIMCTKGRIIPDNKLYRRFWLADNEMFNYNISKLIDIENKIFKEFQFVSYDTYKNERIKFLSSCVGLFGEYADNNIIELIKYVKNRVINIGVYAGSFDPFHIGHYDIMKKGMNIFDKVIIAFGINPEKEQKEKDIPKSLSFIETTKYNGLVTDLLDFIESKGCKVTLIRGIRNGADLSYESNQISFINDIRPNTNVIMIPSDKKYEHISSSAIRNLSKFNDDLINKYLI